MHSIKSNSPAKLLRKTLSLSSNQAHLLPQFRQGEQSRFIILPLPYEKTTSYKKGTARGPAAVLSALNQVEFYDEELGIETWRAGIHTIPISKIKSDLPLNLPPEKFCSKLTEYIKPYLNSDKFLIAIGGEHSITYGLVKAFSQKYPRLSVLQLDAHSDLRDEYEGSRYGHASVIRRVSEICPVTQVGIRSLAEEDYKIIQLPASHTQVRSQIKTFLAHKMKKDKQVIQKILRSLSRKVYLTIDVDVFDPGYLPGVGTPEPGGLSWYEILDILWAVFQTKEVVSLDIVELSPLKDNPISEFTVAKLIYRLIGYSQVSSKT